MEGLKKIHIVAPAPQMEVSIRIRIPDLKFQLAQYLKNLGFEVGHDEEYGDYVKFVSDGKEKPKRS
jgi:hypothetical protein